MPVLAVSASKRQPSVGHVESVELVEPVELGPVTVAATTAS